MRILMVEPQGQGGICHYSYTLCAALSEAQGDEITCATGYPYELIDAPQPFTLAFTYGPGVQRKAIQWALGRPMSQQTQTGVGAASAAGADAGSSSNRSAPFRAESLAGRASKWLALRDADRGWRRTLDVIRRKRPAVVHIQWLMNPERDRQWLDSIHAKDVPIVLTAHNVLPHDVPREARATWTRLYEAADAIIVHYQRALDEMDALGIDLGKVSVIPLGNYCAIEGLAHGSSDMTSRHDAARRRLGLSPSAPVVLSFGLMRPYKGLQYLLEAFESVHQALPEARLILAGRAVDGFASVRAEIARLGLEATTLTFPTYLSLEDTAKVFEACDIVALPYVEASQSAVIQLAYAFSRPVVATRVGGIPEAVVCDETGKLIEPRNTDQLAQAMLTLLRNRERCAQLGLQARQFAEQRFAWEPIAEQTLRVYERAIMSRARRTKVAPPGDA